jgi:iron-sulfur cluster repair protein YtfE (RIC family)
MATPERVHLDSKATADPMHRVRARILADHERLRRLIGAAERVAALIDDGEEDLGDSLRVLMVALFRKLKVHMQYEDEMLQPILAKIDAFGEVRAAQFDKEHEEQRDQMGQILHVACDLRAHPREVAGKTRDLLQRLLVDMDYEEREFLDPDLLRDDIVAIDPEAG